MIAHRLAANRTTEVSIGGLRWRLKRVSSLDASVAGASVAILAFAPTADHPQPSPGPSDVLDLARHTAAIVAASVVAVAEEGSDEWERLTLTLDDDEDPEQGRISYWSLPNETRSHLAAACAAHAGLMGGGQQTLDRFRGASRPAAAPRANGEAVRVPAVDDPA